jgi:hypothetical protein
VVLLPPVRIVKRAMERLMFRASADITPLVRECDITPFDHHRSTLIFSHRRNQSYILLSALVQNLLNFTGLRSIFAEKFCFTQTAVSNLCLLPNLQSLSIMDHRVAPGEVVDFSSSKLQNVVVFDILKLVTSMAWWRCTSIQSTNRIN